MSKIIVKSIFMTIENSLIIVKLVRKIFLLSIK